MKTVTIHVILTAEVDDSANLNNITTEIVSYDVIEIMDGKSPVGNVTGHETVSVEEADSESRSWPT